MKLFENGLQTEEFENTDYALSVDVEQFENGVFENDEFTIIMWVTQILKGARKTLEFLHLVVVAFPNFSGKSGQKTFDALKKKTVFKFLRSNDDRAQKLVRSPMRSEAQSNWIFVHGFAVYLVFQKGTASQYYFLASIRTSLL